MPRLRVSDNRRFLVKEEDSPFFYLGDTAWELFHRLDRAEADRYLQNRANKGFTVIQAVVLAEHEYEKPNRYGAHPLHDNDPTKPNEAYLEHVDYIVDSAEAKGLFIGMLPTWGDKWNKAWGKGPEIFTPENARIFGQVLGKRYADKPIIWILGGDRAVENDTHRAIIEAMASGLTEGDGGAHLRTFHPMGGHTSAEYFHEADWLDFNMWQTGHSRNHACWKDIAGDYALTPVKPCMDAEPGYEDHPNGFDVKNGYLDEYDVRKAAYWDLFAGAFGHTYGCHDIWQFLNTDHFAPVTAARTSWQTAIDLPGAGQVQYARWLLESRPFLTRIPDQSLIVGDNAEGTDHLQATRDEAGSYALIYTASGKPIVVNTEKMRASRLVAHWYDPRTGEAARLGEIKSGGALTFVPPRTDNEGNDWVLVLDDVAADYPAPGTR